MSFFFDYIYYRVARWKFKSQGALSPTALGLISAMQAFILELLIVEPIFRFLLNSNFATDHYKQLGWLAGAIAGLLYLLNYNKYKGKYDQYDRRWGNEDAGKRFFKGILVFVLLLLPMILFIVVYSHPRLS